MDDTIPVWLVLVGMAIMVVGIAGCVFAAISGAFNDGEDT